MKLLEVKMELDSDLAINLLSDDGDNYVNIIFRMFKEQIKNEMKKENKSISKVKNPIEIIAKIKTDEN